MFLKNKNIIFKIRRSKVTDYAALRVYDVSPLKLFVTCCTRIVKSRTTLITDTEDKTIEPRHVISNNLTF